MLSGHRLGAECGLKYPDNFFDVIYGSSILHHVDCTVAERQMFRCLKPGGIAYFHENSDRNPILRYLRRLLFGSPGGYQKQKFLFLKRTGTTDEYPLTEKEVAQLSDIFGGHIERYYPRFYFFYLLYFVGWRNERFGKFLWGLDTIIGDLFPFLKRYSFVQDLLLQKPGG
jgi:SAM-dependent methyltransferase